MEEVVGMVMELLEIEEDHKNMNSSAKCLLYKNFSNAI